MPTFNELFSQLAEVTKTLRDQAEARGVSIEELVEHEHNTRDCSMAKQATEQVLLSLSSIQERPKVQSKKKD